MKAADLHRHSTEREKIPLTALELCSPESSKYCDTDTGLNGMLAYVHQQAEESSVAVHNDFSIN